jgi:pimeloyl-ACP methyl ester carboxylesterase
MKTTFFAFVALLCGPVLSYAQLSADGATASFKGSLPPKPSADISPEQQAAIEKRLAEVTQAFHSVKKHARAADADIFLKAVRYALEFHEWYDKKPEDGVKKANVLLDEAASRIEFLKQNKTPWIEGSGVKVLGFYSNIDDSPQPYGVEVPEGLEWGVGKKPIPMWVWLHGRGDTATDIHFIASQMRSKGGQFKPKGTIVVHPFGRYCNGFKSAGETDVMECKADATARFNVDINRIALAGFSMGGAGAWHLGAHYADQWAVVHTGAGFVDVKRYQKLTPEKMPPWYEQTLWGVYDVPDYAANFHNVPLISYSGEIDSQRDGAEYMTEVLAKEGITRPHLIGPGMGHKYHPEVIKEVQRLIEEAVAKGRDPMPKKVSLQTRCTRYGKMFWIRVGGMKKLWDEARVDAEIDDEKKLITIKTTNVSVLDVDLPRGGPEPRDPKGYSAYKIVIDGVIVPTISPRGYAGGAADENGPAGWEEAGRNQLADSKGWGNDGLIDEAYMKRFIVVLPDKPCANPAVDAWVKSESDHFIKRWRGLMRGDPIVRKAGSHSDVINEGGTRCLWGDATGNSEIAELLPHLPLIWDQNSLQMARRICSNTEMSEAEPVFDKFSAATHVPVMMYNWDYRYSRNDLRKNVIGPIVLNSGLTFREAHDKTNSLQNPKLPDWAILDITQPPNAESAGKVVAADFFDESWQVKEGKK